MHILFWIGLLRYCLVSTAGIASDCNDPWLARKAGWGDFHCFVLGVCVVYIGSNVIEGALSWTSSISGQAESLVFLAYLNVRVVFAIPRSHQNASRRLARMAERPISQGNSRIAHAANGLSPLESTLAIGKSCGYSAAGGEQPDLMPTSWTAAGPR